MHMIVAHDAALGWNVLGQYPARISDATIAVRQHRGRICFKRTVSHHS